MNTNPGELDLYLDDQLPPERRAAFEALLARDPALAAQVQSQAQAHRRIDESLARLFAYEAPAGPITLSNLASQLSASEHPSTFINISGEAREPAMIAPGAAGAALSPGTRPSATPAREDPPVPSYPISRGRRMLRLRAMMSLAAALLLTAIYVYWPTQDIKIVTVASIYTRLNTTGWMPDFVCENDAQFASKVKETLGSPVLIPAATLGLILDGWGYAYDYDGTPISNDTMILLTHVDGQRVLVLMDKLGNDRRIPRPDTSTYRLFRREVGGLVLYEYTPLDQPRAISAAVVSGS